jgi:SET domain-containing protein
MPRIKTKPLSDNKYFELKKSSIQGWGAFATKKIRKGTKIIEYLGERISQDEADEKYSDSDTKRHHTFLFSVDNDVCIDGRYNGNEAIYINHSCKPNCEPLNIDDRIFIYSLKTIIIGEELVYDYGYELFDWHTKEDMLRYKCLCGSDNCRGTILKSYKKKKKLPKNVFYER